MTDTIHVAVAVIINSSDQVCISLRHKSAHQGGLWEFPGGKIEQDETIEQALVREIKEELDLEILDSRPLITITHDYQDKKVCLHVNRVLAYRGGAVGMEGQPIKWVAVQELHRYEFPAANAPIIKSLRLPDKYLITGKFIDTDDHSKKLKNALANNIKLVQLRLKPDGLDNSDQVPVLLAQTAMLCRQFSARLMLNIPADYLDILDQSKIEFDGYHIDSKTLRSMPSRNGQLFKGRLLSASCHNIEELQLAKRLDADFIVLSPVQKTASHPGMPAMGWQSFSEKILGINVPVYALGGVAESDMDTAWQYGAQGIAAISAFWNAC
ncbi:MAG TPA: Nudix family hydrolase [Gammaproteobacteria bacterium]|nr:Nudix family hydrolase [Gammaproteobacteria bacterium]